MKRILTSALALALVIGGPALAQGGKQDRDNARPEKAVKPDKAAKPDRRPDRPGPNAGAQPGRPGPATKPAPRPNPAVNRPNKDRAGVNRPAPAREINRNRVRPRTFDRRAYQRNFNAARKFRGGFYRKPPGWYYRRWTFGQVLPFAFFARNYWLNDYYVYDLPVPPYGYEWVRYGDDALLVNIRTGAILQVVYGIFY